MADSVLHSIVSRLMAKGKGFLAIDESSDSIKKRFEKVGIEDSEEMRRVYRQMLISAPGINEYVSGMILFDETMFQRSDDGIIFPELLKSKDMISLIKVDTGRVALPNHPGEKVVEGVDGLAKRFAKYKELGAEGAKFRSEIYIGSDIPSKYCLYVNAHQMARYASICQELDIVPVVEPEVLISGEHTIERAEEVGTQVLRGLFDEMEKHGVDLSGLILKTSMIISGDKCSIQATSEQVSEATARVLRATVPANVGGVVFLSGGQTPEQATENLQKIALLGGYPWPVTFSYARAIQGPALAHWKGKSENYSEAQKILVERARLNSLASKGEYRGE